VTIHLGESDLAEPLQLGLYIEELVGRVFRLKGKANPAQELFVQTWRGRGNVFQIAEGTAGIQQGVDFGIECALALVHDMMDREAGDDRIKPAEVGKGIIEVVGYDGNGRIAGKALFGGLEHGWREVDCNGFRVRMLTFHQGEQSSISRTQVENAARGLGNELEQCRFAFCAMWNGVGSVEVFEDVISAGPEIGGYGRV
jgi:hypothetical protein